MVVKETLYAQNMKRITPICYWRYNSNDYPDSDYDREPMEKLGQMESQIYAEFLGHSDFNKLTEEKYIEIV